MNRVLIMVQNGHETKYGPGMGDAHVLYVCGGRSFRLSELPRKLAEIPKTWRGYGVAVTHICGGDTVDARGKSTSDRGLSSRPSPPISSMLERRMPRWLTRSISEARDIINDRQILDRLEKAEFTKLPDIVWERSSRLHAAGLWYARRIGAPYVLEWKDHLIDYESSFFRSRAIKLEDLKINYADYIVVESYVIKNDLATRGINSDRILVAYNAVDLADFSADRSGRFESRRTLGIPSDRAAIGYLGSFAGYHDTPLLVEAADLMRRKNDQAIIMMIGDGPNKIACIDASKNLNIDSEFLRFQESVAQNCVPNILSALDIAVLPGSTDIICPIKVQEYMASGLPVVLPDFPANREVVTHGLNGLLFKPGCANELAIALRHLVENKRVREAMGAAARETVLERFSWDATWGRALREILNQGRGPEHKL